MTERDTVPAPQADDELPVHEGDEATVADVVSETEPNPPTTPKAGLPNPQRQKVVVVPLVAAMLFFFGPAAGFVVGDRADQIDNRPLAQLPSWEMGWGVVPAFTQWANDHLPLRSQAVGVGTAISEDVFGEPPQYGTGPGGGVGVGGAGGAQSEAEPSTSADPQWPQVIAGTDDWLYFGGDTHAPCEPELSLTDVMTSLERLKAAVEGSGRKLVLAVVPDKSTMVPEHLPSNYAGKKCSIERKAEFWQALNSSGLGAIDLRGPLGIAQDAAGHPLYQASDTHWSPQGAAVFVQQVVNTLDPSLLNGAAIPGLHQPAGEGPTQFVDLGSKSFAGDLSVMLGTQRSDTLTDIAVDRTGVAVFENGVEIPVTSIPESTGTPITYTATSTAAPLYPGRTLVLGDSFYQRTRFMFTPFFAQLTMLHNQSDGPTLSAAMVEADTVVVELVERSVSGGFVSLGTPSVVDTIAQALAEHPLP